MKAIKLAYSMKGQLFPGNVRAHSTRGMAASWAIFKGISMEEVCAAADWASPHTFVRFYKLNVTVSALVQAEKKKLKRKRKSSKCNR